MAADFAPLIKKVYEEDTVLLDFKVTKGYCGLNSFHRSAFGRFSRKRRLVEITFLVYLASH